MKHILLLLFFPFFSFAQLPLKAIEQVTITEGQKTKFRILFEEPTDSLVVRWELSGNTHPLMTLSSEGVFSWTPDYKTVSKNETLKQFEVTAKAVYSIDSVATESSISFVINVLNANTPPKIPNEPEYVWIEKQNTEVIKTFEPQYYQDNEADELAFRLLTRKYPNVTLSPTGELKVMLTTKERNALPDTLFFEVFEVTTEEKLAVKQGIILQKAEKDEPPRITFSPPTKKFQLNEEEELTLKIEVEDDNDDIKSVEFYTNPQGNMKPLDFITKTGSGYLFKWKPSLEFVANDQTSRLFTLVVTATDNSKLMTNNEVEVEIINKIDWSVEDSVRTKDFQKLLTEAYTYLIRFEPQLDEMAKEFKKKHKNKELLTAFSGALNEAQNLQFRKGDEAKSTKIGNAETVSTAASLLVSEPDYAPIEKLILLIPKLHFQGTIFASKFKKVTNRRSPEFIEQQERFIETLAEARYAIDNKKSKKIEVTPALVQTRFGAF